MGHEIKSISITEGPATVSLKVGARVRGPGGDHYIIDTVVDSEWVLGQEEATEAMSRLKISDLRPPAEDGKASADDEAEHVLEGMHRAWESLSEKERREVKERYKYVAPVLDSRGRTHDAVDNQAEKAGVERRTIYRWIEQVKKAGVTGGLRRKPRSDKGKSRLEDRQEEIIKIVIEEHYLVKERPPASKICKLVGEKCGKNIEPPSCKTVRRRLKQIDQNEAMISRQGAKEAREASHVTEEHVTAERPLETVQMDHSPADLIVVSEDDRSVVLGRPRITVAIDICTRMICGFYVGVHAPSSLSVALCLQQAILPKEKLLADLDIENARWPVAGFPEALHIDNAKEFRGKTLLWGCREYGIDLEWRPVAQPHFGGHIERVIQTINDEVHDLPGTTFGSTEERGDYDSGGKAVFTLPKFRKWLANFITKEYHMRTHSALGMAPIDKWEQTVRGDGEGAQVSLGPPDRPTATEKVAMDFLPLKKRTIQDYGVVIDHVEYYHPILTRWKAETNENGNKRKFLFRRDPRDISVIWLLDPDTGERYYEIPYRNNTYPAVSKWELKAGLKKAKEKYDRKAQINQKTIFESIRERREMEEEEGRQTRRAKREKSRKKDAEKSKNQWQSDSEEEEGDRADQDEDADEEIPDIDSFVPDS